MCIGKAMNGRVANGRHPMLIVIRLLGFLAIATIGASLLAFLLTRNRRWLNFAWQLLRFSVVAGLVLVLLYVLERTL